MAEVSTWEDHGKLGLGSHKVYPQGVPEKAHKWVQKVNWKEASPLSGDVA